MIMMHVIGTKISDTYLGTSSDYLSVLTRQWVVSPWIAALQIIAVVVIWLHACIGLHFWLADHPMVCSVQPFWRGGAFAPGLGDRRICRGRQRSDPARQQQPDFVDASFENAHRDR